MRCRRRARHPFELLGNRTSGDLVFDGLGRLHFVSAAKGGDGAPALALEPGQVRAAVPLERPLSGPSVVVGYAPAGRDEVAWEELLLVDARGGRMPVPTWSVRDGVMLAIGRGVRLRRTPLRDLPVQP